jgi:hypothetical protein
MHSRMVPRLLETISSSARVAWMQGEIQIPIFMKFSWLDKLPLLGLVLVLCHPTIAAVAGSSGSLVFGAVALLMLLPELRRIVIIPFLAIIATSCLLCILDNSPHPMAMSLAVYAVFSMSIRRPAAMGNMFVFALFVAFVWGQIQFFSPPESIFNAHATVISPHLYYLRPTTFFPAQIYYNQFLLMLVAVFVITGEKRWWVMVLWGAAAASAGSTGGVVCAVLALGLWHGQRGFIMTAAFLATFAFHGVFFREWWLYNYSVGDLWSSVFSERLLAQQGADPAVPEPPSILHGIIQFTALGGIMTAAMAVLRRADSPALVFKLLVGALALVVVVGIQPILGSLYFSLHLGLLAAIVWVALSEGRAVPERVETSLPKA